MKKETATPDSKEGLHTQGEWKTNFDGSVIFSKYSDGTTIMIARIDKEMEAAKANAELIVKAVNERKALLDSHRELLEALIAVDAFERLHEPVIGTTIINRVRTAIRNSKNIK